MPVASGGSWRRQAATIDSERPAASCRNLVAVELCRHLGRRIFFTILSALIPKQDIFRLFRDCVSCRCRQQWRINDCELFKLLRRKRDTNFNDLLKE